MSRSTFWPLLALLLLGYGTAQAADWVSLGKTNDGKTEILIDLSSIRVAAQTRTGWVKQVHPSHAVSGSGLNASRWIASAVYFNSFNCGDETMSIGVANYYYEDGTNSVDSSVVPWGPVAPDTVGHTLLQFICSWKAK